MQQSLNHNQQAQCQSSLNDYGNQYEAVQATSMSPNDLAQYMQVQNHYARQQPLQQTTNLRLNSELTPHAFTLTDADGHAILVITFDPPDIHVDIRHDWNAAAKCFWNAVHRVAGKPAKFPDAA